jgi:biotin synthase
MCYAIPGKVVDIKGNLVVVDYFGEKKKARNEFFELKIGEYIYAQGGFVVQKVEEKDAISILETWKEIFIKLKEVDLRLARETKTLYQIANAKRQKYLGNSCCVHGIIEFSNYCKNDCLFCGIRKSNNKIIRYRMEIDEIVSACEYATNELKFKALVLQSGEDPWYTEEKLVEMVRRIREKCAILLVLSIGERSVDTYKKLYDEGARGVLLRFETGKKDLYKRLKPDSDLDERLELIRNLYKIGYMIFTGFLIGLPGQSGQDIIDDINLTWKLNAEMFSFGPFIPHPETPLKDQPKPSIEMVLNTIARARILYPNSKVVVTTALETLDKKDGARQGLLAGANSLMINVTPEKYRHLYEIYPDRAGSDTNVKDRIKEVLTLLYSLGRAPTDLGV